MPTELSSPDVELIKDFLFTRFNPDFILLFGSAAQNRLRPESDIDLAFMGTERTDAYERFIVAQELAGLLGRDVDLIDLREASTVLRVQVICSGRVLHNGAPDRLRMFNMIALKEYALLNEERLPVIEKMSGGIQ